ncbi:MAG: TetR/AcrR family transcriptional regulator [Bacillota bacterium]|nr:TetR/AcrR family transcriptional regulator [Bacillota bacterium]
MEQQKGNRRVRKTKKLLLQGLTQLMSEKKINKITVKELTDLVDVNRATFYLYYKDIFDMVEKVETEMFDSISEVLANYFAKGFDYDNSVAFFTYVFEFVQEYADMCKILLGPDGDYAFIEKFKKFIGYDYSPAEDSQAKFRNRYAKPFVISGCIGVIQQWLEDDMKTPIKDMALLVVELITNCGMFPDNRQKPMLK